MPKKKVCSRCKEEKPLISFRKRKDRGTYESHCKECGKKYHREWYHRHKEKIRPRMNAQEACRRKEVRSRLLEYFKQHPCKCGESRPAALDFDHVRGVKGDNVSNMVNRCSWERIVEEIAKCEVRCANCHRAKTAKERGWYLGL